MNYSKKTFLLILFSTIVRCIIASVTELGNDEVYYRLFASHLQWNYFDHPPMVAWLIRITTFDLFFNFELFIRLPAIISAAIATQLMFLCGKKLANAYTGFLAACIYSSFIYGSIISGIFILPDSPQMICWSIGLYLLINITESDVTSPVKSKQLLLFGIITGIGMLCKIHTIFLWFGLIIYILFYNRKWLKKWELYVAGLITLLFFYPVIKWNIDNHFITFTYHSNRINIVHSGIHASDFLTFIGGQVFYVNPVLSIFIIAALLAAIKNNLPINIHQKRILLLTSLPLIISATVISFYKPVLPHWTGPGYLSLILLTAIYFTKGRRTANRRKGIIPIPIKAAGIFLIIILISGILVINYFPGTFGKKDELLKGDGDFTLDMYGWKSMGIAFDSIYKKDHPTYSNTIIVSNKWFPAAHIEQYIARPLHLKVFTDGPLEDIHQYYWINKQYQVSSDSCDIYVIIPSNYYHSTADLSFLKNRVPDKQFTVIQLRNRQEARKFYISYFKKNIYKIDAH